MKTEFNSRNLPVNQYGNFDIEKMTAQEFKLYLADNTFKTRNKINELLKSDPIPHSIEQAANALNINQDGKSTVGKTTVNYMPYRDAVVVQVDVFIQALNLTRSSNVEDLLKLSVGSLGHLSTPSRFSKVVAVGNTDMQCAIGDYVDLQVFQFAGMRPYIYGAVDVYALINKFKSINPTLLAASAGTVQGNALDTKVKTSSGIILDSSKDNDHNQPDDIIRVSSMFVTEYHNLTGTINFML